MASTDPPVPAGCMLHGIPFGQSCFLCWPALWHPQAAAAPLASGWRCPQCSRSLAPSVICCPFCVPAPQNITPASGTGEAEDGPVLRLPAYMASGYQVAQVGAEWAETLPGLEACAVLPPDDQGRVTMQMRLAPPDGQRHG